MSTTHSKVNHGHRGNGNPNRPSRRGKARRREHAAIVSTIAKATFKEGLS